MVRKNGFTQKYVIDPSLFNRPVTLEEWKHIQTKHAPKENFKTSFTPRFSYLEGDKDRPRLIFSDKDFQDAQETNETYLKYQNELELNKAHRPGHSKSERK
jgi:hypothetical protein